MKLYARDCLESVWPLTQSIVDVLSVPDGHNENKEDVVLDLA
jgi:hypothetical protein